jgi:cholesterol transport system auxiliary component
MIEADDRRMRATMRNTRLAAIPLLALCTGACFGGGSAPAQLLTLTAAEALAPGATRTADAAGSIAVVAPSVPRAVATTRIPVYVSETSIQYLVGATWVEEPRELFRTLLAETIAARTGRLVLDPSNFSQGTGATLSGQLLQFGFDPTRMEVVVAYEAALSRSQQPLQTQRFEARVPVTAQDALTVAPALNQAANQVAEQVADWIGRG